MMDRFLLKSFSAWHVLELISLMMQSAKFVFESQLLAVEGVCVEE